jgi:hypothetical protein
MTNRRQDPDYRRELVGPVLQTLSRGESCAVVGVGSTGKSRLLLHLTHPETVQAYLGARAATHMILLIECNAWVSETSWAAFESMTRVFLEAVNASTHLAVVAVRSDLDGMYQAVTEERDLAFTHLQRGLRHFIERTNFNLTFCFDEFDFVFERVETQLFRNLRAIRNQNKYNLTYLLATRKQIPYQRPRSAWPEVEEFTELFTENLYPLGPYNIRDASAMVADLEARYGYPLDAATRGHLLNITGNHPGLIGTAYRVLETLRQPAPDAPTIGGLLLGERSCNNECRKIWESLRDEEQSILRRMVANIRLSQADSIAFQELVTKGLLKEAAGQGYFIFSPIFEHFVRGIAG